MSFENLHSSVVFFTQKETLKKVAIVFVAINIGFHCIDKTTLRLFQNKRFTEQGLE